MVLLCRFHVPYCDTFFTKKVVNVFICNIFFVKAQFRRFVACQPVSLVAGELEGPRTGIKRSNAHLGPHRVGIR
jgi:hypothetical protein